MKKYIFKSLLTVDNTIYLSENLMRIIKAILETDSKLKGLSDKLKAVYERMVANKKRNSASALTQKKAQLDQRRDQGYISLRDIIHGISLSLIPEDAEKALSLYRVFEAVGTTSYSSGYKDQTASLSSLFSELDKPEQQTALTDLALLPYYGALKTAEDDFLEIDKQMLDESTENELNYEPAQEIMVDMVPALTDLVGYMELSSSFDAATYGDAFNQMVTVINEVNATARARLTNNENDSGEETEN
ncbi:DUF6261 family protein [Prolixibacter sp. SD074]|jgi:hypothetical protein|uniref:DUF6261 family protein n=1 Tax=Prolixibacter sp. SD074 TaxID=2652391 RepID=UPI00127F7CD9|nr:DUF6261 family protein [Prolixibacter sp. SD074]GET30100.1 hypothetical protein SD074_23020 [Prolixibacter sp. SD074]